MKLGMTIKELQSMCDDQIKKGNGDKHIIIMEGAKNIGGTGYHNLNYGFITDKEVLERIIWLIEDEKYTVDNCVALG